MKTNRRGFFGALAGLASGVVAAFMPSKKVALGKVENWEIDTGGPKPQKVEFEDFIDYAKARREMDGEWTYFEVTYSTGDEIVVNKTKYLCGGPNGNSP